MLGNLLSYFTNRPMDGIYRTGPDSLREVRTVGYGTKVGNSIGGMVF